MAVLCEIIAGTMNDRFCGARGEIYRKPSHVARPGHFSTHVHEGPLKFWSLIAISSSPFSSSLSWVDGWLEESRRWPTLIHDVE